MIEETLDIATNDGGMETFICRPERGRPYPAIFFLMDAPGIREELRDMARRIGTVGYYVVLPNLYYRTGTEGNYGFDLDRTRTDDGEREKMLGVMRTLSNQGVVADTGPLLDFVRGAGASAGPMGCVGYCMSGQFVMSAGAAYADDFAAIAAYYGIGIITEAEDSPHRAAARIKGEVYLAFAEEDVWVPPEVLDAMPGMLSEAGLEHRVEIYPGTEHGFAFSQRPAYHKAASERHWERLFSLFERKLRA